MNDTHEQTIWWGAFTLAEEQAGRWQVGPSTCWVYRTSSEWRIIHLQDDDPLTDTTAVTLPLALDDAPGALEERRPEATVTRFSFHRTDAHLRVSPGLADRAVVVRTETPLYVLAHETVTLYVSTPLWLRVEVGEPGRLLHEIPTYRPSDTWFGPSTLEGEVCYAARSAARLRLEDIPPRLHRAVTPITIHNTSNAPLLLERIRLPVQHLALYQAPGGVLWTQAVTLNHADEGDPATVNLQTGPAPEARDARPLQDARDPLRSNLIVRTFSSLFHKKKET